MIVKIAVVDDSSSFLKVMKVLLENLEEELNTSIRIDTFESPIDYKNNDKRYDIVILDCIFKSYDFSLNGINLANISKEKHPSTKVILTSEFAENEFLSLINQYSSSIDFYTTKKINNDEIITKIKEFIKEMNEQNKTLLEDIEIRFHVYKESKRNFNFYEIDYARVEDRSKHLISIGTKDGEKLLSMTLNNFLDRINNKLADSGISMEEKKIKSDLYINISNIKDIDRENLSISFSSGNSIKIDPDCLIEIEKTYVSS